MRLLLINPRVPESWFQLQMSAQRTPPEQASNQPTAGAGDPGGAVGVQPRPCTLSGLARVSRALRTRRLPDPVVAPVPVDL